MLGSLSIIRRSSCFLLTQNQPVHRSGHTTVKKDDAKAAKPPIKGSDVGTSEKVHNVRIQKQCVYRHQETMKCRSLMVTVRCAPFGDDTSNRRIGYHSVLYGMLFPLGCFFLLHFYVAAHDTASCCSFIGMMYVR